MISSIEDARASAFP